MVDSTENQAAEIEDAEFVTEDGDFDGAAVDEISLSSGPETDAPAPTPSADAAAAPVANTGRTPDILQRGFVAFEWKDYQGLRDQQKMIKLQEKQQGRTKALGYTQINPKDKSYLRNLQGSIFQGNNLVGNNFEGNNFELLDKEERERKEKLQLYYDECREKGTPVLDTEVAKYTGFEDKIFEGFRLDKKLNGTPVLAFRVKCDTNQFQEVFDDGKNVRAITNGSFNARSAMAMATTFWGNRGSQIKANNNEIDVNINTKGTLSGAMGGVTAEEKRNFLIIANLHMAHKQGVKANIKGAHIGNNEADFENYVKNNEKGLQKALEKYNQELASMGEEHRFSLKMLENDPRTNNAFDALDKIHAEHAAQNNAENQEAQAEEQEGADADNDGLDDASLSNGGDEPDLDGGSGGAVAALPSPEAHEAAETKALEGDILGADEVDPFQTTDVEVANPRKAAADGEIVDAEFEDVTHARLPDAPKAIGYEAPKADEAVASEPRQSHGNGAQADPKVVDTTLKSEQAQRADAALGGQDSNLPARAGTPGAVIEQPAATPEAEKPKPRLPGPTGHQAPGR